MDEVKRALGPGAKCCGQCDPNCGCAECTEEQVAATPAPTPPSLPSFDDPDPQEDDE